MDDLEWQLKAECRNHDADLWFPSSTGAAGTLQAERAAAICGTCPVIEQCRANADKVRPAFGVWAGEVRRDKAISVRNTPPHGSEARARWDRRRGITPCELCRHAANEAHLARKQRRHHPPASEKHCRACDTTKPGTDFYNDPQCRDGLSGLCRDCKRIRNSDYKRSSA